MSAISSALGRVGQAIKAHPVATRVTGATLVGGAALGVLAACTPVPPRDADQAAKDLFGEFDENVEDNGVTLEEASVYYEGYVDRSNDRYISVPGYNNDYIERTTEEYFVTYDRSAEKGVRAADKNNDAIASWAELAALAKKFDTNDEPGLDSGEYNNFRNQYGAEKKNATEQLTDYDVDTLSVVGTWQQRSSDIPPTNGQDPYYPTDPYYPSDPTYPTDPGYGGSDPGTGPGTTDPGTGADDDYYIDPYDPESGFGGSDEAI